MTTIEQNITLELLFLKDALERKLRRLVCVGQLDLKTAQRENSLRLDRSVQEICWLYVFAGSNPALSKPCIKADYQPPEAIRRHIANKNNLLSLFPITFHNRRAKFGFLTQPDTNPIRRTTKPDPLRIAKALDRQDEFDSVMAWPGKMLSACNELELNFQRFSPICYDVEKLNRRSSSVAKDAVSASVLSGPPVASAAAG